MESITNISVWFLEPHPDNPRKDVGDIAELTESVKCNGIMQNLTVIPWAEAHPKATKEDLDLYRNHYTLIIGHRRFAAAKAAGLKEVPCAIIEGLSYKEQIGIMLTENVQRSDLTVYEQASGFQMMLDLGDSIKEVSDKTGFSESTVRRRVKLMELDGDALKRASSRQVSIFELDKLSQIEDIKVRNKVLDTVGTKNFDNELSKALKNQETQKKVEAWLSVISPYNMKEIPEKDLWGSKYTNEGYLTGEPDEETVKKLIVPGVNYYYCVSYGTVYIRSDRKRVQTPEQIKEQKERQKRERLTNKFSDMKSRFFELRYDFIKKYPSSKAKEHYSDITAFIVRRLWTPGYYGEIKNSRFANLLGLNIDGAATHYELIREAVEKLPEKALLYYAYVIWNDERYDGYCDYANEFKENSKLDAIYDFLAVLGYEMSDEELAFRNGTHKLFLK